MLKDLVQNFDEFRYSFNKMYKLEVDGKFKGLSFLGDSLPLFVHKFNRMVLRSKPYLMAKSDRFVSMRLNGHNVKVWWL